MDAEILLTLKLQGNLFADPRRIELLKRIRETGSISQGAKLASISYKSAWDAVNEMNQLSEQPILERSTGGKGGGGATLTPYGERLLQLYDLLGKIQQKAFDVLQDDRLPLDSLLAAIARFSLQTSARNQFFGTVEQRDNEVVQEHITILLNDGISRIRAALTQSSADRLSLSNGKEVLALIKAPWVQINAEDPLAQSNQLSGRITQIKQSAESAEVLVQLDGGEILCATLPTQQLRLKNLQEQQTVTASFSPESVIVATLC